MRSVALGVIVLVSLSAVPAAGAARAEAAVTISSSALGNVFAAGAKPSFTVRAPAPAVTWSARDYWGHEVAAGEEPVWHGAARLSLPVRDSGYYDLKVAAAGGGSAETTFALLPRAERVGGDGFVFGMQTHFGQADVGWDPRIVPLLEHIGVESVRDAQQWQAIETSPGTYDFSVQSGRFEKYMAELARHGIEPLMNFGLYNPHHDDGATPHSDRGRHAFARFAQEVLRHYGRQIGQVGVYNEPNHKNFGDYGGGPADARPDYHLWLAREVYRAVKAVRPDVTVTSPQLSAGEQNAATWLPWLAEFFRIGGLEWLDAMSLHPYRLGRDGPEGLPDTIATVRDLMEEHGHGDKPIWITEMGWRTNTAPVSEHTQAQRLPRAYVLAMSAGVERFHWYNFMDHASGPFGVIRAPGNPLGAYTPKPAYVAYGVLTDQLTGLRYHGRDDAPDGVHSHRFGQGREAVRVMWVPQGSRDVSLATDRPVQVTDAMGTTRSLTPDGGRVSLTLTGDVLYVRGTDGPILAGSPFGVRAADSAAGEDVPVTVRLDTTAAGGRPGATAAIFTVAGRHYPLVARAGEAVERTVAAAGLLPPRHDPSCPCANAGERTIRAEVRVHGKLTGLMATPVTIS